MKEAHWSFHADEEALAEEVRAFLLDRWGIRCHVNPLGGSNAMNVTVSLVRLEHFFDTFGRGAPNKRIPWWAWEAPAEFIDGLISGWLDGDGTKTSWGRAGTTTSAHLAWGIRALATRLRKWPGLRYQDPRKPSVIKSWTCTPRHGQFTVEFRDDPVVTTHIADDEHVGLWVKETARRDSPETVYNFAVADESYVTTGGTVHNLL